MLTDYQFLQPGWLWVIPLLWLLWFLLIRRGVVHAPDDPFATVAVRHPQAAGFQVSSRQINHRGRHLVTLLSGSLILLAVAQPVRLGAGLATPADAVDVMLIIDTSVSMILRDYQLDGKRVNRMVMTQALLDRFTRRFSAQRIGIVVLGEQPHLLLHPTPDKDLVRHFIHRLKPAIGGRLSSLGDAVAVTAAYLKSDRSTAETVMILISDAVTPYGQLSPVEGARRAAAIGAVLHTIAIGSTVEENSVQLREMGELIYQPADLELLKHMADITGGKRFHATDVAAMDAALHEIERVHKNNSTTQATPKLKQPLYVWPLFAAILLLMAQALRLRPRNPTQGIA